MDAAYSFSSITVYPHHSKQNICGSRAKYRDGRKDTAVKVYTVNQESIYLLISNVPAVGGAVDLRALCDQYGIVEDFRPLDDYPAEEFTEVYLAKYSAFPAARIAKKQLDDKSFLGSTLHVCYAPEFETVQETRLKLQDRRKYVAWKTNTGKGVTGTLSSECNNKPSHGKTFVGKHHQSSCEPLPQPVTYVWAGKEYTVYPKSTPAEEDAPLTKKPKTPSLFVPRQLKSASTSLPSSAGSSSNMSNREVSGSTSHHPLPNVTDSSYQSTISHIRQKVSKVSVPNVRVSLKRRRRL